MGKRLQRCTLCKYAQPVSRSFSITKKVFEYRVFGYPAHFVSFYQKQKGFIETQNKKIIKTETDIIRVGAIEILFKGEKYKARYRYVFHRAYPARKRYAPELGGYSTDLEEEAFDLEKGEYGRLVYNGRFVDSDTGHWYYQNDTVNLVYCLNEDIPLDIFQTLRPDKNYSNIAILP